MHQQSRRPPRAASPASSPQTNPTRTNNPREGALSSAPGSRGRAGSEGTGDGYDGSVISESEARAGGSSTMSGPSAQSIKKLDQIIQNFYHKVAVLVLQSRLNLPTSSRSRNKWFQLDTDEIDVFRDELRVYKSSRVFENPPPPLIIETYIDASRLSSSQALVVMDEYGKRWDVLEALNSPESSTDDKRNTEVILERWRIELRCNKGIDEVDDFGPYLPTIYKKAIVFFRSLFVATRIMPCWKYSQQSFSKSTNPALEVKCRVLRGDPEYMSFDALRQPLFEGNSRDAATDYMFGDVEVPVGRFYASVTYRNDCNFRVDDSESLLSSRFMGVDENFFKPSITSRGKDFGRFDQYGEVGSLPSQRQAREALAEPHQTYGSLSTFHGEGALGTSPMTALKSVKAIGSDTSSPPTSSAAASIERDPPHSLPIRGSGTRPSSLRNLEGTSRRPSVSFQPFKAGSLSGSPRLPDPDAPPSSPGSLTRPSGLSGGISQARNRSSLTAGMAASLRNPTNNPPAASEAIPVAGSPKPATTGRYSSSFTHRRSRPSFGGGHSRGTAAAGGAALDDDQISSGKQSLSSSAAQPGSGLLTEIGGNASSGSFQTDDDNISEFLKVLDSRKSLASFEPNNRQKSGSGSGSGISDANKRAATQLYKFHMMRESNNLLTESMTSSVRDLARSSTTTSSSSKHQLPPPQAAAAVASGTGSMSTSTSPGGKPLSPHTPHTPAIPSRLSENSIIEYRDHDHHRRGRGGGRGVAQKDVLATEEEEEDGDEGGDESDGDEDETPGPGTGTGRGKQVGRRTTAAIDIPTSPRMHVHGGMGSTRRASSVAQRSLVSGGVGSSGRGGDGAGGGDGGDDDDDMLFATAADETGQRSISLGADGRDEAPSLSTLLAFQRQATTNAASGEEHPGKEQRDAGDKGDAKDPAGGGSTGYAASNSARSPVAAAGSQQQRYGGNLLLGRALGAATAAAVATVATGSSSSSSGAVAHPAEDAGDDEPLLFAMSELERPSRRSLERGSSRGGAGSGNGRDSRAVGDREKDRGGRGGFEPKGTSKRGWP